MQNKRCIVLIGVLLLCGGLLSLVTSPQVFASSYVSTVVSRSNSQRQPPAYVRGYRQGYNDAVYDCLRSAQRFTAKNVNDYNRGYTDGYNSARAHDRACIRKPPQHTSYTLGYRQGYNDAVYDCQRTAHRFIAKNADDYNQGYSDGYVYARAHERVCIQKRN